MSNPEVIELREYTVKRSSIKGRVTKFKNQLNALEGTKLDALEISKLNIKLAKFEALFNEFDGVQEHIELLNEENLSSELNERDLIEQDFFNCIAIAQVLTLSSNQPKAESDHNSSSSSCDHHRSHCQNTDYDVLGFRLPIIKIPNFDGTYYKWLEFKETFTSLVHDNTKIKNIHKFHYLNSYLEGEAARVLCNLEVSDQNYTKAWKLLCERYDNPRQLINNHLKSLFNFETVRESDKSLRFIIDHVTKNLRALSTLGLPTDKWDVLIIYMVTAKLDNSTCFKWEEHRNSLQDIPTLDNFFSFLKSRADVLETVYRNKQDNKNYKRFPDNSSSNVPRQTQPKFQPKAFVVSSKDSESFNKSIACVVCTGDHRIYDCSTFKSKSPDERIALAASLRLCGNCLRKGHDIRQCRLPGACRTCRKRHNTMLHKPIESQSEDAVPKVSESVTMSATSASDTLLCTALVDLINPITNQVVTTKALLDCGSQSSFITEELKQKLNLPTQTSNTHSVVGIGNTHLKLNTERCTVRLQSKTNTFNVILSCLVLPQISGKVPKSFIDTKHLKLSSFQLADPSFNHPSELGMLIGADIFWDIIGSKQHSLGKGNPILHSSKLGWLLAGPISYRQTYNSSVQCNFVHTRDLHDDLSKFFELESFPQKPSFTEAEKLCEQHFISNTKRDDDGRFIVKLPLIDEPDCLGDSYQIAKKRLSSLERRFKKQPEIKKLYSDFIHEYAELGHLSKSIEKRPENSYFLPHHPVIRDKSESTRLRVVFDASSRTSSGLSVNDIQMIGPTIQDSLFNILVRFRQHQYVISADIAKMYRQCLIADDTDRNLQLILWRDKENEPITTLKLNTVTYGFSSASFLATRCLWQLGEEHEDESIKEIIQKDFYMDDLLTGHDDEQQLLYIQQAVSQALLKGAFPLRKYRSNSPALLSSQVIDVDDNLMLSQATNTLGLGWNQVTDDLHFPIEIAQNENITKRSILSTTFKIFDPLGLLSLCTIIPKILIQELWSLNKDWDEPAPAALSVKWKKFIENLTSISSLTIPRWILAQDPVSIEMHCFCDASQRAYGVCIYIRSTRADGSVHTHLLCAKSRVAPIKPTTIPRLELCGALLSAQLSSTVTQALRCQISDHFFWTDSSVVLAWLRTSSNKLKTFVANRVAAIQELTNPSSWRHVPTSLNPADLLSRGVDPKLVPKNYLWWRGPNFLLQPESSWPPSQCDENPKPTNLPEIKVHPAVIVTEGLSPIDLKKYSKLKSLQRIVAYINRFVHNCKNPTHKFDGPLQVTELDQAFTSLVKISQKESFETELALLNKGKALNPKSNVASLSPFLDTHGVLRVGGRIEASEYSYDTKHPILLKSDHHLTKLLFRQEHERLLHAGPQQLLTSLRSRIWPMGGRNLARRTARNCPTCRRFKGQTMKNIMGNLPAERLMPDFPFHSVGTDYAGPFMITDRKGRGCKITKCYLCIFICLRFKCIHLEAVSELTKDAFILTLKRFISRRGVPKEIFCDNGRNFVAAAKEIKAFLQTEQNISSITDFATGEGIEFRFSPAYAPHFNGLMEAGVKSAKFHISRILGNTHLTYEELSSLFSQIEAILNSRPICPLSSSPDDYYPLTPGHFLIGRPLRSLPAPDLMEHKTHRLDRFQRIEQFKQHFWKRWTNEYISELQQRTKWRERCKDLQPNDLVLIKEDHTSPLYWRLGRVQKLFPGPDGVPRVADVSTARGNVRRAINRICLLPNNCDES